jgi:hypothetical protein
LTASFDFLADIISKLPKGFRPESSLNLYGNEPVLRFLISENDPVTVLFPELLGPIKTVTGASLKHGAPENTRKLPSNNPFILSMLKNLEEIPGLKQRNVMNIVNH